MKKPELQLRIIKLTDGPLAGRTHIIKGDHPIVKLNTNQFIRSANREAGNRISIPLAPGIWVTYKQKEAGSSYYVFVQEEPGSLHG
jgi:hypothetical protein